MDFVILSNDQAIFDAAFPPAVVVPLPGIITGSSRMGSSGPIVCVEGDEATVSVPGVPYTSGPHTTPGVGVLTILSLGPDQRARQATSGGRSLILRGTRFQARFQVVAPAQIPSASFDSVPVYFGTGSFQTTNGVLRAQ